MSDSISFSFGFLRLLVPEILTKLRQKRPQKRYLQRGHALKRAFLKIPFSNGLAKANFIDRVMRTWELVVNMLKFTAVVGLFWIFEFLTGLYTLKKRTFFESLALEHFWLFQKRPTTAICAIHFSFIWCILHANPIKNGFGQRWFTKLFVSEIDTFSRPAASRYPPLLLVGGDSSRGKK